MEQQGRVARSMAWTMGEKVITALLQFAVGVVVSRRLTSEDFGVIAILWFFVSVSLSLADSGFSQALIRKSSIDERDRSSVFYFNVGVAVCIYLLLLALIPWLAQLYDAPVIRQVAPVLFLIIPVNALANIQHALLSRDIDFRTLSQYALVGSLTSGVVSVVLVLAGAGVWTLVLQRLSGIVIRTVLLWTRSSWRPRARFSWGPVRAMFGYSSRILATDLLRSSFDQIVSPVIGGVYSKSATGFYDKANSLKSMPVDSSIQAVLGVSFSALARRQDDPRELARDARRILSAWAFLLFPVMLGLVAVAHDAIRVLLTDKWLPTVPFLQILSLAGIFAPVSVLSYNIVKIMSGGGRLLRIEVIKKLFAAAVYAVAIPLGVEAIAWGAVAIYCSDMTVNMLTARRYVPWRVRSLAGDVLPSLLLSGAMLGVVVCVGRWAEGMPVGWSLVLRIVSGAVFYLGAATVLRLAVWRELRHALSDLCRSRRG